MSSPQLARFYCIEVDTRDSRDYSLFDERNHFSNSGCGLGALIDQILSHPTSYATPYLIGISISIIIGLMLYGIEQKHIGKPKISIELRKTEGFDPYRTVYELSVINKRYEGFAQTLFERKPIDCWVEASLWQGENRIYVKDGRAAAIFWGEGLPSGITLKPSFKGFNNELLSKVPNERGFHMLKPLDDTLISATDALLRIEVKDKNDNVIAHDSWPISNKLDSLEIQHLED